MDADLHPSHFPPGAGPAAASAPTRLEIEIEDGAIAGWRWPRPGAPRLVFSHATGFCASAYKPMLAALSSGFDVFAFDMRGHGRTRLPADPRGLRDWSLYARDLGAVMDRLDPEGEGLALAGHSCGAVVSLLAARRRLGVAALALIEPVAMPSYMTLAARTPFWPLVAARMGLVRGARARRNGWPDRAAVRESYSRKPVFAGWAPGVLEAYLEDGLVETAEGVRLACNPAWEAATYAAQGHDLWGAAGAVRAPFRILGAEPARSTLIGRAPERFRRCGATVERAAGAGHLFPMENPEAAAVFIAKAAAAP